MTWNWYGTPNASGGISGMQSDVRPVSSGFSARLTRYFSAPGFKVGPVAAPPPPPLPPPPNAYTPEKSGLPSGVRAIPALAGAAATDGAPAPAFVPATVTVTERVTAPVVSVNVVVAAGLTRIVPLGNTRPTLGSMAGAAGFSMCHTSSVDSPGLIDDGCASKV